MSDITIGTAGGAGIEVVAMGELAGALRLSVGAGLSAVWVDSELLPVGVCTGALGLTEMLHQQDAGAEVRYLFSTDRRNTWQRYNGSAWVAVADPLLGSWAEANPASAITPLAMSQLKVSTGTLHMRIWMKTGTPGNTVVLKNLKLSVGMFLPVMGMVRPDESPMDLQHVTVITTGETGDEERWQKRSAHRREWDLKWSGLTQEERDGLVAFVASKLNYAAFAWTNPDDGVEYTVRLDGWGMAPTLGARPFYNAQVRLVQV